jgi:elongation factor P
MAGFIPCDNFAPFYLSHGRLAKSIFGGLMISVTELRNNTKVEMDGSIWECLDYQHQKIGRGGAKVVAKFRNLESGSIVERTFNATEKLQNIFIDYRKMQFLYGDGETYTFMDLETYEQPVFNRAQIGDGAEFLKENLEVDVDYYQGRPIAVTLPNVVELKITQTDPGLRGDTASGGSKPATLETGAVVSVPLFIEQGETIRVDTRTSTYLSRA